MCIPSYVPSYLVKCISPINTYRIVGNFHGRKLSQIGGKKIFLEKTFVNNHKSSNFINVFSLKSA